MDSFKLDMNYSQMEIDFAFRVFEKHKYPFRISRKIFGDHSPDTLHRHDFLQAWYCISGEYIHYADGITYTCKPGSLIIIPPGMGHTFKTTKEISPELICIQSTLFFFASVPEPERTNVIVNLFLHSFSSELRHEPLVYMEFSNKEKERIENTLLFLSKFDYSKNLPNILQIRNRICKLFSALPSFSLSEKQRKFAEKIINTKILPINNSMLYMNKNFGSRITSKELCSISAMCYSDFFKYFKKTYGVTYTKYLQMLRLQWSKTFIAFSRYSFDYIADICGITDRTYLSKLFSKYYGYTMKEERARQAKTRRDYPFAVMTHDSVNKLNIEFDI